MPSYPMNPTLAARLAAVSRPGPFGIGFGETPPDFDRVKTLIERARSGLAQAQDALALLAGGDDCGVATPIGNAHATEAHAAACEARDRLQALEIYFDTDIRPAFRASLGTSPAAA